MNTHAFTRALTAALVSLSITTGASAAVIDPALAALLDIPEVDVSGAYAEATAEAISSEFLVDTASAADPVTVDVSAAAAVTGASGAASAGADFPAADGTGSAARASASVVGSVLSVSDSVGTAFVAGDFTASGGGAGPHSVTFTFDIDALITLADGDAGADVLGSGLSAFAVVFDDTFQDVFLGGFSLDGGGAVAAGTTATRSGDFLDSALDPGFTEDAAADPASDCVAAALGVTPNRCSWGIDTTASVTFEYTGESAVFSLVYGIQTSVLGAGTVYELISDASGTSVLSAIQPSAGVNVVAQPSQLAVAEPVSVALLGLGLLATGAATRRRRA